MSDEPESGGFTFKDRRRTVSEPTPEPEQEPSFVVNDRRHTVVEPQPAPQPEPQRPAPPAGSPGFGFGAPPPPQAPPMFGGFGGPGAGPVAGEQEEDAAFAGGYDEGGQYAHEPTDLPDVRDILIETLMTMRTLAAIRLGLAANPMTGQPDVDLDQGRMAVDSVAFLVDQLEPSLPHQDRLPLRAMVSEMRLRYVELARELGA